LDPQNEPGHSLLFAQSAKTSPAKNIKTEKEMVIKNGMTNFFFIGLFYQN